MKRAHVVIKDEPVYRRAAFVAGLARCGYDVHIGLPTAFEAETVLVCWNRYHENHVACSRVESAGGSVIIAENGYIAMGGASPHGMNPREWYALAPSYHNDSSTIRPGGYSRWHSLDVNVKPWEEGGEHILVCPNRNFGTPGRIMPIGWADDVVQRLKKFTRREIRVRPHPGNSPAQKPLSEDLSGAWACVIWSSSAGVHALVVGVPVICDAPFWIAKEATGSVEFIEAPPTPNRQPAFERIAWAQWNLSEIQSGEAFDHLLRRTPEEEVRAAD